MRRTVSPRTAVVVVVALLVSAVPAAAQDAPPPPDTTTVWEDTTLIVTAAAAGSLELTDSPGAPHDGPVIRCAWFSLRIRGTTLIAVQIAEPTTGDTYLYNCWFAHPWADRHPGYPIVAVFDPIIDPPGPLITTPVAARHALASIEFERPGVVTSPPGIQVVGIPSWFAVDSRLDYAPASAQAGPVWATVRPVFRDVTWSFGDGDVMVCTADATTQWNPSEPDAQNSACTHTYRSAGADQLPLSATASWTVWQRTDRTAGAWEVWGTVSLTTSGAVTVIDLQAAIN
jgi:hypothetical protein